MRDQFVDVSRAVIRIGRDQVGANAGRHKHFTYARQAAQASEQGNLCAVVGLECRTAGREEATLGCAGTLFGFALALKAVHVGSGAAHVLDDAGEGGVARQAARFFHDRVFGAADDLSALVDGNRTEVALTITATVRRQREADGVQRTDFAFGRVDGMHVEREGQRMHGIQFGSRERRVRRHVHQTACVDLL